MKTVNHTEMDGLNSEKSIFGRILISGASGMLGRAISSALRQRGANLLRLVRREPSGPEEIRWDPSNTRDTNQMAIEIARLEGINAAVHLSGANVAGHRWTAAYKREMTESRAGTTRALSQALASLKNPPSVLVAASAAGFYGNRGDEILDEDSDAGQGYFPQLCTAWEAATQPAEDAGIRVVHLRLGMVIGRDGGALARLAPIFRLGLGGPLGNGRQWMSWISETDAVAAALFAITGAGNSPPISGPVNLVAPTPVTNAEFTRELAKAVHRPALLTAPAFALRLVFGEMADEALLASTRVLPRRLLAAGFAFTHPTLPEAFATALNPGSAHPANS